MEALGTDTKHGRCCVCMEKNKICTRNVNLLHIFQMKCIYFYTLFSVFSLNVLDMISELEFNIDVLLNQFL